MNFALAPLNGIRPVEASISLVANLKGDFFPRNLSHI